MQTRSQTEFHEPILLLDPQPQTAADLAAHLVSSGFPTWIESNAIGAQAAIARRQFATLILVADIHDPIRLDWLDALRGRAARSWIIVVGPQCDAKTCNLIYRHGGDACMTAPVSFHELTRRLTAFQLRARPLF
jgi:DNA-binding response OmpR family regulator